MSRTIVFCMFYLLTHFVVDFNIMQQLHTFVRAELLVALFWRSADGILQYCGRQDHVSTCCWVGDIRWWSTKLTWQQFLMFSVVVLFLPIDVMLLWASRGMCLGGQAWSMSLPCWKTVYGNALVNVIYVVMHAWLHVFLCILCGQDIAVVIVLCYCNFLMQT